MNGREWNSKKERGEVRERNKKEKTDRAREIVCLWDRGEQQDTENTGWVSEKSLVVAFDGGGVSMTQRLARSGRGFRARKHGSKGWGMDWDSLGRLVLLKTVQLVSYTYRHKHAQKHTIKHAHTNGQTQTHTDYISNVHCTLRCVMLNLEQES